MVTCSSNPLLWLRRRYCTLSFPPSLTGAVEHERWSHVLIFLSCNSTVALVSSVVLNICDRCKVGNQYLFCREKFEYCFQRGITLIYWFAVCNEDRYCERRIRCCRYRCPVWFKFFHQSKGCSGSIRTEWDNYRQRFATSFEEMLSGSKWLILCYNYLQYSTWTAECSVAYRRPSAVAEEDIRV